MVMQKKWKDNNMNKKIIIFLMILFNSIFISNVKAINKNEIEKGFTNKNGVVMSEENYKKIRDAIPEEELNYIDKTMYDEIASSNKIVAYKSIYLKEERIKLYNGTYLYKETEISPEEYAKSVMYTSYNDVHNTTYKHIHLMATDKTSKFTFYIQNVWQLPPATQSFDVLAFRWSGSATRITNTENGSQDYYTSPGTVNPPTISYPSSSSNYKRFSNGIGLSQNLVGDSSSTANLYYYTNTLSVDVTCSGSVTLYGTYQHAQSDLTLNQSKSYTLSSSGLGGVLYYSDSSIRNKYDNTAGLSVTFTC